MSRAVELVTRRFGTVFVNAEAWAYVLAESADRTDVAFAGGAVLTVLGTPAEVAAKLAGEPAAEDTP